MTIIGIFSAIGFIFCESCRPEWVYHFGPHRMDQVDSFEFSGREYRIYECYKGGGCRHRDTFPSVKYAELADSSVKIPNR